MSGLTYINAIKMVNRIKLNEWKSNRKEWLSEKSEVKRRKDAERALARQAFANAMEAKRQADKDLADQLSRDKAAAANEYHAQTTLVKSNERIQKNNYRKIHSDKEKHRRDREEKRKLRDLLRQSGMLELEAKLCPNRLIKNADPHAAK